MELAGDGLQHPGGNAGGGGTVSLTKNRPAVWIHQAGYPPWLPWKTLASTADRPIPLPQGSGETPPGPNPTATTRAKKRPAGLGGRKEVGPALHPRRHDRLANSLTPPRNGPSGPRGAARTREHEARCCLKYEVVYAEVARTHAHQHRNRHRHRSRSLLSRPRQCHRRGD